MSINVIRRIAGYVAVPVVTAGIIGGAAIGLASVASADTTPSHPGGALASVSAAMKGTKDCWPCFASVGPAVDTAPVSMPKASVSDPAGKKASVSAPTGDKASVNMPKASVSDPAGKKASVSDPAGKKASVNMPKASVSDPAGKKASVSAPTGDKASVNMPKASASDPASKRA